MGGRSRGISPILNSGRSATTAQRGTTICGSEAGRRHRSARYTCAPTNSILARNPSGCDECWSALLDLCVGKRTRLIDQPATWRRLRARGVAPDQDKAIRIDISAIFLTGCTSDERLLGRPEDLYDLARTPGAIDWQRLARQHRTRRARQRCSRPCEAVCTLHRAFVPLVQRACLLVACRRWTICQR